MKSTRKPHHGDTPYPQPLAEPGEQRPQHFQDEDEAEAFSFRMRMKRKRSAGGWRMWRRGGLGEVEPSDGNYAASFERSNSSRTFMSSFRAATSSPDVR